MENAKNELENLENLRKRRESKYKRRMGALEEEVGAFRDRIQAMEDEREQEKEKQKGILKKIHQLLEAKETGPQLDSLDAQLSATYTKIRELYKDEQNADVEIPEILTTMRDERERYYRYLDNFERKQKRIWKKYRK